MESLLHYAGLTLDRADQIRRDPARIEALWQSADCRVVPVIANQNLIRPYPENNTGTKSAPAYSAALLTQQDLNAATIETETRIFLGFQPGTAYALFAVAIAATQQDQLTAALPHSQFADIRSLGVLLDTDSAALLAYARGIVFWRLHHRFCGHCGSPNIPRQCGHAMHCSNEACGQQTFPRTDPAVIMLVEARNADNEPVCLLGRHPNWPEGVYSTLAGFVEPGESLEDAVRREVHEEAGVKVRTVQYLASQPWPFPSSIMLGFSAQAESMDITLDPQELADAQWFTAKQLQQFKDWGSAEIAYKMPRSDSIARYLINHWLHQQRAL